ncbi:copper chaperone PCu(A)C [Novosphingobium cyanobacteriorum]|uniref:Copper chaperone PCu(A)C n=1 Tax=Novosphingobium cyanobacteriorum TaxID=3024215 RepID=A0ABT6CLE4_9SPHN|nr:copper chaperone PCu(A)C [Novosphingobium cyanobacteriorum]MDF8334053.1 copper chaperone PCu(A)C [Novosphingobium cyanobacteriorum]
MRHLLLPAAALAVLALSGCGKGDAPTAGASSAAPAADAPSAAPGMMLSDAMVRLPAVSGNPGVAYFTLSQGDGAPRKLVAVHVDGFARAEMHQTVDEAGVMSMKAVTQVPIEAGKAIEFKPGGYHVMLFDADGSLKADGDTELTITLDNGDKASVRAKVEAPGGDEMGHMDHM